MYIINFIYFVGLSIYGPGSEAACGSEVVKQESCAAVEISADIKNEIQELLDNLTIIIRNSATEMHGRLASCNADIQEELKCQNASAMRTALTWYMRVLHEAVCCIEDKCHADIRNDIRNDILQYQHVVNIYHSMLKVFAIIYRITPYKNKNDPYTSHDDNDTEYVIDARACTAYMKLRQLIKVPGSDDDILEINRNQIQPIIRKYKDSIEKITQRLSSSNRHEEMQIKRAKIQKKIKQADVPEIKLEPQTEAARIQVEKELLAAEEPKKAKAKAKQQKEHINTTGTTKGKKAHPDNPAISVTHTSKPCAEETQVAKIPPQQTANETKATKKLKRKMSEKAPKTQDEILQEIATQAEHAKILHDQKIEEEIADQLSKTEHAKLLQDQKIAAKSQAKAEKKHQDINTLKILLEKTEKLYERLCFPKRMNRSTEVRIAIYTRNAVIKMNDEVDIVEMNDEGEIIVNEVISYAKLQKFKAVAYNAYIAARELNKTICLNQLSFDMI